MVSKKDINEYVQALKESSVLGSRVVGHRILPRRSAAFSELEPPFPEPIEQLVRAAGIHRLYKHQVEAITLLRNGKHVALSTPTASGKTLVYNLPILEELLNNPEAKALYVYPLKALAQDQRRHLDLLIGNGFDPRPTVAIYDGDTPANHRKSIRESPPNVILTNPEMIHLSFLPYHHKWASFLKGLQFVVIDEVHVYRGIFGAHIAQVFRRMLRIFRFYGVAPTFIFCSATVGNPSQLAEQLTGLEVNAVIRNDSPQGKRHIVFVNPYQSMSHIAVQMLTASLHRGLRTIVYAQSRKLAELLTAWTKSRLESFADRISVYRAGLTPEERRDIESKLAGGDLLGVITTSALELGIDIGDLDLCILLGYPGSVVSTWQRGGRVGRSGEDCAIILIAQQDALDQYFMRDPDKLLEAVPEVAVVNPFNEKILPKHLVCAAAELPLADHEPLLEPKPVRRSLKMLTRKGILLLDRDGENYHSTRKMPQRTVDLRGIGDRFRIVDEESNGLVGESDRFRVFREVHPGAVYLHKGDTYVVHELDDHRRTVWVRKATIDYYTRIHSTERTEIIGIIEKKKIGNTRMYFGKLSVTEQVKGYEQRRIRDHKRIGAFELDLPPLVFETEGLWFPIPPEIEKEADRVRYDFLGGLHALEHAAIGILPLMVLADRNDFGGASTTHAPEMNAAAVFIYDGIPGGAGLCLTAFNQGNDLLKQTLAAIQDCPCQTGCPGCVHSPKCGSGNRPIDKEGAISILKSLMEPVHLSPSRERSSKGTPHRHDNAQEHKSGTVHRKPVDNFGVLDIETQLSAQEVGGWHRADRMRISCAVVYDSRSNEYHEYMESQTNQLIAHLERLDLVVGFNTKRFDYIVLKGYDNFDVRKVTSLDLMEHVHTALGFRLSLNHLAKATLGVEKSADGLQALKWWKEGRIAEIVAYCRRDVDITRQLFMFGKRNGYLLFDSRNGETLRIPVLW